MYNKLGEDVKHILSQRGRRIHIVFDNRFHGMEVQMFTDGRSEEKNTVDHRYFFGCIVLI